MKKIRLLALCAIVLTTGALAQQNTDQLVQDHFAQLLQQEGLNQADFAEWRITDMVPSINPDVQHIYVQQYYKGIPIEGATFKLNTKNQRVTWSYNHFVTDLRQKAGNATLSLSPEAAISRSSQSHGMPNPTLSNKKKQEFLYSYDDHSLSDRPITAKAQFVFIENELRLVWKVSISQKDGAHYWNDLIDATTGALLSSTDAIIRCEFGDGHDHGNSNNNNLGKLEGPAEFHFNENEDPLEAFMLYDAKYNVYARPMENPYFNAQINVIDPADLSASPDGWHATNGSPGNSYTYTRGNNVWVKEDLDGNDNGDFQMDGPGTSPYSTGPGLLEFNYDHDDDGDYTDMANINASIVNAFYWTNLVHDITYHYGFNPASGNFQETHYGSSGSGLAGDFMYVDIMDRWYYPVGIGAEFRAEPDGASPTLVFYDTSVVNRALDNIVIVHEYGHGISTRLVGGPGIHDIVSVSQEQMGEGWSDWLGLMLTMKPGDTGANARRIGQYFLNQGAGGAGIRPHPYTTDTNIHEIDYADIQSLGYNHGVGFVWATILWDLTWALIDEYGYDDNLHTGSGGNNIAMALIIEGMKNTPVNMGFVSGRDAILQADQDIFSGAYSCLIWEVFAARGVGVDAEENNDGGANLLNDQTLSYDTPCLEEECESPESLPYSEDFESSIGAWTNDTSDDLNWTRDAFGTPTPGTGPSGGGQGSTWYMYVEATGSTNGDVANFISPCFDLTNETTVTFSFDYHMKGTNPMGRLDLDISSDGGLSWANLWGVRGHRGDDWLNHSLSLNDYAGQVVQVRFRRTMQSSQIADVAIDNINITSDSQGGNEYCELSPNDYGLYSYEYLNRVTLGDIDNVSGTQPIAYRDFTNMSTTLNLLSFNTLQLEVVNLSPTKTPAAFIDWNADGDFFDAFESLPVLPGAGLGQFNATFTVPFGAIPGPTRMRIFVVGDHGPCGINAQGEYKGEVEDYTVIVPSGLGSASPLEDKLAGSASTFSIFPNPVSGNVLNISVVGEAAESYVVHNLIGQQIISGDYTGTVDVSRLPQGVYLITVFGENNKWTAKFVKN